MVVHFIAMPVTLGDVVAAVDRGRKRPGLQRTFLASEPHRPPEVRLDIAPFDAAVAILPFGDERDHRVRTLGLELGAVSAVEARHVPRIFDDGELHAEADAEIRDAVLAREANRLDFAFDAALAE